MVAFTIVANARSVTAPRQSGMSGRPMSRSEGSVDHQSPPEWTSGYRVTRASAACSASSRRPASIKSIAAWLLAKRRVSTLVLVHRQQLLDQWVERLSTFLGIPRMRIGRIGGGRRKPTGLIDVALIQSLVRKGLAGAGGESSRPRRRVDDGVADYGHLIVDECHHLSAHSFEQVARRSRARYVLGLSATVTRKDGHHPIIFMQCGPVRHRVSAKVQAAARPFTHSVFVRPTAFVSRREPDTDTRVQFQALYRELAEDERRNRFICDDVLHAVRDERSPLVLTERHDHLDRLVDALTGQVEHLLVFRGQAPRRKRGQLAEQLRSIPNSEARVLLATGRCIGESTQDAGRDEGSLRAECGAADPVRRVEQDGGRPPSRRLLSATQGLNWPRLQRTPWRTREQEKATWQRLVQATRFRTCASMVFQLVCLARRSS